MADNKICFSDVKMAGNAGDTEIITAADKTVYGFTGDNDSDNYGLLTALFQLRYFASSVIYRQQTDDIQLIFRSCTEYSPVLRELRTDNYIIPAGDIAGRFRPFVHDHPVVFLDPPSDDAAAITDKGLNTAAQGLFSMVILIRRIISSYSKFSKSEKPEEINGLVFIAMPERHLNILWHEHCIPLLQATFPKTVFYLTTQSPVILSQLNDGEAYRLFRDSGEIIRTQKYS
ncbi:hypothetical protein [Morganella morganii]|uniref:hypothetical protein n=1 Tax=Morganella morganii TaxID=582 RepID=UPI001BDB2833|nr:hypothetical protein [Morganella morganii]ELF0883930.1 hypothetical protein [Morganella morganii]MBT0519675.1 hypothetical protein [Morganella morganii subsp. morganii]QWL88073.1 hypothetical protein IZ187_10720 [Morganella morganii subsp. morganii]HCR3194535.1 hypothetical protein [Morganella morganii]HEI8570064.1 hypothetical protein [Morganella morganii]